MGPLQPLVPLAHPLYHLYAGHMPEGDQKVFADPEIEAMFVDDLMTASRRRFGAFVHDVALFGQPWGFDLADVDVPVFWWHGDADNIVPMAHAEHAVGLLRGVRAVGAPDGEPPRRLRRRRPRARGHRRRLVLIR